MMAYNNNNNNSAAKIQQLISSRWLPYFFVLVFLAPLLSLASCAGVTPTTQPPPPNPPSFNLTGTFAAAHFFAIKVESNLETDIPKGGIILSANTTPPSVDIITNSVSFHAVPFTNKQEHIFLLGTTDRFTNTNAVGPIELTDKSATTAEGLLFSSTEYWVHFYLSNANDSGYRHVQSEKLSTTDYTMITSGVFATSGAPELTALTNFIQTAPITYQAGKVMTVSMTISANPAITAVDIQHDGVDQATCAVPNLLASCTTGVRAFPAQSGVRPTYYVGQVSGIRSTLNFLIVTGNINISLRGYN